MGTQQLRELDVDECLDLLGRAPIGRLAFVDGDRPDVIPLNHLHDAGTVVIRTGYGRVLEAVHKRVVAFEVDHFDVTDHSGWSVVVHGIAEEVWDTEELTRLRDLPLRPWAEGERDHWIRILPTSITGRRIGLAGPGLR